MSHPCANESKRVSGYNRGKRRRAVASIFLLLLSLVALENTGAQEAKGDKGTGSVSGRITVQGKPASGLAVALFQDGYGQSLGPIQARDKTIARTTTDEEGRYRLTELPAGRYWIRALAPQYVTTRPDDQLRKYDAGLEAWQLAQGDGVSVGEGKSVTDVNLELLPAGTISGRITDMYGNPVVGEPVYLFGVTQYGVLRDPVYDLTTRDKPATDSSGEYRVEGIPPGRYVVGIGEDIDRLTGAVFEKYDFLGPQGRIRRARYYEEMFYPGAPKREAAHVIEIAPAAEVKEINFAVGNLQPTFTARGRLIDAQTGKPLRGKYHIALAHLYGEDSRSVSLAQDQTAEDGSFELSGLLAERFSPNISFAGDTNLYSVPVEFAINDADVSGLEIKVYHGLTVSGAVVIEDDNDNDALARLPKLKLQELQTSPSDIFREMPINADGSFKLIGLRPGTVELSIGYCDVEDYFKITRVEYAKGDNPSRCWWPGLGNGRIASSST